LYFVHKFTKVLVI